MSLLLARAFLDAQEWEREELMRTGSLVLGARRRWLGPLVRATLAGYPRRPGGGPRELARWIAAQAPFTEALDKAYSTGRPISVAHHLLEDDTTAGAAPVAPGPGLEDAVDHAPGFAHEDDPPAPAGPGDLAWLARELRLTPGDLDWFADTRHWNRRAPVPELRHYRYAWRERPGRVPRLLEVPGLRLRTVQRRVLDRLLAPLPLHDAAHGFVPGRSARTNASLHTGAKVVMALDLTSFFAHVTPGRIFGVLRGARYPEATAYALAGLCTHAVPAAVLRAMPEGGTDRERFDLVRALRAPHLPQGAPSSPALANLSVRRLDARLHGWAEAAGGRYTRYADDLAFSGPLGLAHRSAAFVRGVERIVAAEGHAVNLAKTRVRRAGARQAVTGIVVNEHTSVTRPEYDALKATLHNCEVHGPESQRRSRSDLRAHLAGRVAWVESLDPRRGGILRAALDRIEWP